MDTDGKSGGKTGNLEVGMIGRRGCFTRVEKIMVLDWGQSEMVVNSCLEDMEGRMRLRRMWKLVPRVGKNWNK